MRDACGSLLFRRHSDMLRQPPHNLRRSRQRNHRLLDITRQLQYGLPQFFVVQARRLICLTGKCAGVSSVHIFHFSRALSALAIVPVSQNDGSHAAILVPGRNLSRFASARTYVSCTRSFARSALPHSDRANARKAGAAANMELRGEEFVFIDRCPLGSVRGHPH